MASAVVWAKIVPISALTGLERAVPGSAEGLVDLRVYAASVAAGFMMSSNSTGVSFPSRR